MHPNGIHIKLRKHSLQSVDIELELNLAKCLDAPMTNGMPIEKTRAFGAIALPSPMGTGLVKVPLITPGTEVQVPEQ